MLSIYKKRKLQRILLEEKIGQILNEYEQKSQRTKLENDQKILGLEEQLKTLNSKKDDLQKKILNADKEVLAKQNDIIQAKKAKQAVLMEQLERTDVYHAFMMKVQAKEKASTKDFVDLGNLIDLCLTISQFAFAMHVLRLILWICACAI